MAAASLGGLGRLFSWGARGVRRAVRTDRPKGRPDHRRRMPNWRVGLEDRHRGRHVVHHFCGPRRMGRQRPLRWLGGDELRGIRKAQELIPTGLTSLQ